MKYCSSYFAMDYVITLTGTELNKLQAIQRLNIQIITEDFHSESEHVLLS